MAAAPLGMKRAEGHSTVRKGKAQTRLAQAMGVSTIQPSQRRPLAFTICARGPHGIPVDTFGGNLLAASTFNGVIQAEEHNTARDEHGH